MQKVYVVMWGDSIDYRVSKIFSKPEYAEHYIYDVGDNDLYIREFPLCDDEYKNFIPPSTIGYRYEFLISCEKENCGKTLGDCELLELRLSKGYKVPITIYPDSLSSYWLTLYMDEEFTTKEAAVSAIRNALKELGYECGEIEVHNWIFK